MSVSAPHTGPSSPQCQLVLLTLASRTEERKANDAKAVFIMQNSNNFLTIDLGVSVDFFNVALNIIHLGY